MTQPGAGGASGSRRGASTIPTFSDPYTVDGDRATVEWHAVARDRDGRASTIAGISLLRFDERGLVVEEHGYWNVKPEAP